MTNDTGKTTGRIGWALLIGGIAVLAGYGVFEFAQNMEPTGVKLATAAVAAGIIALFITVLRQRLKTRKTDKYKDVDI